MKCIINLKPIFSVMPFGQPVHYINRLESIFENVNVHIQTCFLIINNLRVLHGVLDSQRHPKP